MFEVEAEHDEGVITFVIRDRGHWRAPRGTHRGRGLAMMRALMESVDVNHDEQRDRGRAAADAGAARGMNPLARVDVEWHGDTPVAAVDGEVDASNVADVAAALRNLVTNRSSELVVDLSPTDYLDSAGINLMFALGDELRSRQLTLRLVIAPKSPIARMLSITGLDRVHPTYPTVAEALSA